MENRGRPRQRERRPPELHKARSRERNPTRSGKHRSRTPTRKRPTPVKSSSAGRNRDRLLLQGARMDQEPSSRRLGDRDRSRDRDLGKMRMDRDRGANRDDMERKKRGELDRVVKRAREERTSYWHKRVLEAEEKDPSRWGHSGFKELYRRDMNLEKSPSGNHGDSRRSPGARRKATSPRSARKISRSRSPRTTLSKSSHRSPVGRKASGKSRTSLTARRISPLMSREIPEPRMLKDRRTGRITNRSNGAGEKRDRPLLAKSRNAEKTGSSAYRSRSEKYGTGRSRRKSSGSMSRSGSRSSGSPPAKVKRTLNTSGSSKGDPKNKEEWTRNSSKNAAMSVSRSRSRSISSSSSSSEDGDVLELHANSKRRGRGSTLSRSSSSSSDDSKSSSSSASSSRRRDGSGSSSSSSSSDSESDYESDISGKITVDGSKKTSRPSSSRSKESEQLSGKKKAAAESAKKSSGKTAKNNSGKSSRSKDKNGSSKDSDSDSGSSSDSADSEPRMTLSERFAKLTQMSTDKREFAKPVIAMNEIDTKLKVVKDLRNADVKIYVDGQPRPGSGPKPPPSRAKSPEYNYEEGEKRFTSDERRRYFERMERDEPRDRPADWSDSRVRFEYYRDRGYFNDRPLTFDEYTKWEQWWYAYRDWLESEGYYSRMGGGGDPRAAHFEMEAGRGGRGSRDWPQPGAVGARLRPGPLIPPPAGRRVEQVPTARVPLSSRPHFMGRTEGGGRGVGRSIDRSPGGSLVVNIRQGSSFGPRGRHVGVIRGRNR